MRRVRGALRRNSGALAGLLVGVLVVASLLAGGKVTRPLRFSDRDASDEFLAAWARYRGGTFVVDADWSRATADGRTLEAGWQIAQEPPRRVVRQLGSITGELDGKAVNCFSDPSGAFSCAPGAPLGRSYADGVRTELDDLRDHFRLTSPPIYRVRPDEHGCFELTQTRPFPNPTFGRQAQVCFDAATGAMTYMKRSVDDIVETVRARSVRSQVLPTDFELTQQ